MRTHQEIDERSLALHRLIAEKIRRDPSLLDAVRQTVARWQTMVSASSRPYLSEWANLLAQGPEASLTIAEEDSPNAAALRQSGREKDWPFVETMLQHGIIQAAELRQGLEQLPVPPGRQSRLIAWLAARS